MKKIYRHRIGPNKMLNCFFPIVEWFFNRRIKKIIYSWPFHFLAVTKANNIIHFRTNKTKDRFAPFWFEGHLEIFRRDSWT